MTETLNTIATLTVEAPDLAALRAINAIANDLAFRETGARDTCIYTSAALRDALLRLGYRARMLRVEAAYYPPCECCGGLLGFRGDGTRQPAASPGMWRGHVAVGVDETYLLDPTLDQLAGAEPFVGLVTPEFLAGERCIFWFDGVRHLVFPEPRRGTMIRYFAFPTKGGWKSKPAYRCSRRDLVDQIVRAAEAKGLSAARWTWRRRSGLVAMARAIRAVRHREWEPTTRHAGHPSGPPRRRAAPVDRAARATRWTTYARPREIDGWLGTPKARTLRGTDAGLRGMRGRRGAVAPIW